MMRVLAAKYPGQLLRLYRKVLDERPEVASWEFPKRLLKTNLPLEDKVAVLVHAANHTKLEHKRGALEALLKIAPDQGLPFLIEALRKFPLSKKKSYHGSQEPWFAVLVSEYDRKEGWEALAAAARDGNVFLRLELLGHVVFRLGEPGRKRRALQLLEEFLDDATVRTLSGDKNSDEFFSAGYPFRKLEVRNFAARQMAFVLDMPLPERKWSGRGPEEPTADDWAELRRKVREKAKVLIGEK